MLVQTAYLFEIEFFEVH